jgi:hypothetical protein
VRRAWRGAARAGAQAAAAAAAARVDAAKEDHFARPVFPDVAAAARSRSKASIAAAVLERPTVKHLKGVYRKRHEKERLSATACAGV